MSQTPGETEGIRINRLAVAQRVKSRRSGAQCGEQRPSYKRSRCAPRVVNAHSRVAKVEMEEWSGPLRKEGRVAERDGTGEIARLIAPGNLAAAARTWLFLEAPHWTGPGRAFFLTSDLECCVLSSLAHAGHLQPSQSQAREPRQQPCQPARSPPVMSRSMPLAQSAATRWSGH